MDRIAIRNLRVETHIGWSDQERATPQPVYVTAEISCDLRAAGAGDDLADTIDYDRATTEIADLVRGSNARLLEHLAEKVASHIAGYSGVAGVSVEVAKESPPVSEDVGAITVRVSRP